MEILENNWDLLSDSARKAIKKTSKKKNVINAEAFYTGTQTTEVTIRDSEIKGNSAANGGGAFRLFENSSPEIINCSITENSTENDGGGLSCKKNCSPTLTNCTIADNSSETLGTIVTLDGGQTTIINSIIWGNIDPTGITRDFDCGCLR